ncbi:hypothetical protein ACQP0C_07780 [Nocardia sp. CA-129566]|uniref:hypothetical protein n=1 Tax=Nocardia sp. CA-129566 TaxID=3239976 RepID=UPI003D98E90C
MSSEQPLSVGRIEHTDSAVRRLPHVYGEIRPKRIDNQTRREVTMREYYQGDPQELMHGAVKIRGLHDQLVGLRSQFQNAHNGLTENIQTDHLGRVRQEYGDNVLSQWNDLHGSLQQIYETLQKSGVNMAEVDRRGGAKLMVNDPGGGRINLSGI